MGDVLPPKRQTVVDRLRRRLELYRRHQGSCLPRYDQAANGIYDAQREETMLLKQRFLEAKAKKTKRAENRHAAPRDTPNNAGAMANTNGDLKNAVAVQSKVKRAGGSPLVDYGLDGLGDGHPHKMARNTPPDHPSSGTNHQQQATQQQNQQPSGMPSFSVQIVQQFTSSNTSQAPHSQTIQTNVTVQALSGGTIKSSKSPMATSAVSTGSPINAGDNSSVMRNAGNMSSVPNGAGSSTSISVGTSIECKQEPDMNFASCSVNSSHPTNDLNSETTSEQNNNQGGGPVEQQALGDRFSDSLANLGFPEDSGDDVIHPDILKDIIDDVFTNPSELMNGFSFVDNVKDNNVVDDKEAAQRSLLGDGKNMMNVSNTQNHFQNSSSSSVPQFTLSQSQQSVFDFQSGTIKTSSSPITNVVSTQGYAQNRLASYTTAAPSMQTVNNSGLGLDFKLSEPSPAAQTLKQMAEQHQNMQQKQQQLGLGLGVASHPRSPFMSEGFPDPLSSIRSNFLNGSPSAINQLQKTPSSLFQSVGYNQQQQQQQGFGNSVAAAAGVGTVKQEIGSPSLPVYTAMNQSPTQVSEMDLNKRRHQALQMQQQQQQQQQQQRPAFSQSPDQKALSINSSPLPYPGTVPLTHYNDAMSVGAVSRGSASSSPISHPGQFMRGVSTTPGVTPPPANFGSPSPSSATIHLSQSQQIQVSQNSQQLQVSQSQQQIAMSHDLKPPVTVQAQQQQQIQGRGFYPGHQSIHVSQAQSINFQFGGSSVQQNNQNLAPRNQQQVNSTSPAPCNPAQRPMAPYAGRPPPDYQSPLEPSPVGTNHLSPGPVSQQAQRSAAGDGRSVGQRGRKGFSSANSQIYSQMDQNPSVQSVNGLLNSAMHSVSTGTGRGRGSRGGRGSSAIAKHAATRHQRPPNVNVGPEGLNISQRPPMSTDWRHVYMQQQQQQVNSNLQIRIPYSRAGVPGNFGQVMATNPTNFTANSMEAGPNPGPVPGSPMSSRMTNSMSAGMMVTTSTANGHMLMQQKQQQIMIQNNSKSSEQIVDTSHMVTSNTMSVRDPGTQQQQQQQQHHHQQQQQQPSQPMFDTSTKPPDKLQDPSHALSSDSNEFILDFLDNICANSDLLNFDVGNGSGGPDFPLLDDMNMLGK